MIFVCYPKCLYGEFLSIIYRPTRPRQPPAYAPHRPDGENRRLGMGIGIEGEPHSKPQLQVTPSCIPQFATMKRNWWPNAGPIVERIRRGDIAQITCGTEPLMMGG